MGFARSDGTKDCAAKASAAFRRAAQARVWFWSGHFRALLYHLRLLEYFIAHVGATSQRQTNGATLETWFSFSWKLSDGNGHFVSGYWSGDPVMDTTGTLHGCSEPTFLGYFRFSLGALCRGTLMHGPLYALSDFAVGYFTASFGNSPADGPLCGASQ